MRHVTCEKLTIDNKFHFNNMYFTAHIIHLHALDLSKPLVEMLLFACLIVSYFKYDVKMAKQFLQIRTHTQY